MSLQTVGCRLGYVLYTQPNGVEMITINHLNSLLFFTILYCHRSAWTTDLRLNRCTGTFVIIYFSMTVRRYSISLACWIMPTVNHNMVYVTYTYQGELHTLQSFQTSKLVVKTLRLHSKVQICWHNPQTLSVHFAGKQNRRLCIRPLTKINSLHYEFICHKKHGYLANGMTYS